MRAFHITVVLLLAVSGQGEGQGAPSLAGSGYDRGNPDAAIAVVEFGDFGCSACAAFARETFGQLEREYITTGKVRWKYVPFILGSFPNSMPATRAAECAAAQDAFWSMHDLLYERQREWVRSGNARAQLEQYATQLKLDLARFRTCWDSDAITERIRRNNEMARSLMVRATPTFFINSQRAVGALPIEQWRRLLQYVSGSPAFEVESN